MNNIQIEILLGIIAFSFNSFLGLTIYLKDRKNMTNVLFGCLSLVVNIYIIINFLSLHPPDPTPANQLFWIRQVMFITSFIGPILILLVHTFPKNSISLSRKKVTLLLCLMVASAGLAISPYLFTGINFPNGQPVPTPGPGIFIFFLDFIGLFILSFIILIFKYKNATGADKIYQKYLLSGVITSFSLMGLSTVTFVVILKTSAFVFLGPIFPVILMSFIAYAIVKHGLFSLNVIATEALSIVLLIILFSKIFVSETLTEKIIDTSIFITVMVFIFLLIRSVINEVKQREKLEILDKELESANIKLKTLDQARAEFITIASHQLRTPPATIKWYLSAVLGGDYGTIPTEAKEPIEKAQRTNNGLISLIDDMLNVSRIERGKMEFLFQEASIEKLVGEIYEQLMPMAVQKNLSLTYTPPVLALPKIMADSEKIKQVINNMVDNALKYTKKGEVVLKIFADMENIHFEVKDTGKGFDEEEQKAIFEKYMRGKESQNHSAGLGLGMYVAKAIIQQHHGKIWAESQGVGKGSAFIFTLPIKNNLKATTLLDLTTPGKIQPS